MSTLKVNTYTSKGATTMDVWTHLYQGHPSGGYGFDVNEDGSIPTEHYFSEDGEARLYNLAKCLFPVSYDEDGNGITCDGETIYLVEKNTQPDSTWTERIVSCQCGEKVDVTYERGHGTDCDKCGRIYSWTGQTLAPRNQWEERWDDDSTQPYCVEFGYSDSDY